MDAPKLDPKDSLKSSFPKLNQAIDNANKALNRVVNAENDSVEAKEIAERTQSELSQAILKGDSSPLAGQLSVGADGTIYKDGPQERFITEFNELIAQLVTTFKKTDTGILDLNVFNEQTRAILQGLSPGQINAVLGNKNVKKNNYDFNSIPSSRTTFRIINNEKNQLDLDDLIEGKYWNTSGAEVQDANRKSTDFIYCYRQTKVFINSYSYVTFWDENQDIISGVINSNVNNATVAYDIPANATYLKVSIDPIVNTDLSVLFVITSNNPTYTSANINSLKEVEYKDPKLVIEENNLRYLNLAKSDKFVVSKNDYIVLPNKIFTTTKELISWVNPIMASKKVCEIKVSYNTGGPEWGKRVYNFNEFDWSKVPDNTTVTVFFSSDNELKFKKDIIVNKKSTNPTTTTIKELHIGDSITNRGLANSIMNYLSTQYGVTGTPVGTMINNNSRRGEGREGWKFTNFIGKSWVTQNDLTLTAATGLTDNQLSVNPFIKVATSTDLTQNPDYCFTTSGVSYAEDNTKSTYYIFDFANYLSVQSIETPDVITIALSTNDILSGSETYIEDCRNALLFMIKKIREALPMVKIGVIPTFNFGMNKAGNELQIKALKWAKVCIDTIESLKDANCDVVPTYVNVDRLSSFPVTSVAVNGDTNVQETTISDYVHNNSINIHANTIAQWIINVIS
ncbi:SGNH/GDSL hydrolase family protein [Niallia circulans]|uniref:SGNH/GDSL hydrolase family protein n=1 Tax=Niallia circulans TaxID=1397 RepID=UPI002E251509|nr:SGNH/GDSL hydrolase family protein [Niallia circulans]